MKLAIESLGLSSKKHRDWFDDECHGIRSLLQEKHAAHDAVLRNPNSINLRQKWNDLRNKVQKGLRHMENNWLFQKVKEIHQFADTNDMQKFYEALKTIYGPAQHAVHPLKSKDGNKRIKDYEGK